MDIGHYISGLGHAGLLGWMAFGGFFEPQNEPLEIREVAIVSAQEFDALFAPEIAPERAEDIVELPSIEP